MYNKSLTLEEVNTPEVFLKEKELCRFFEQNIQDVTEKALGYTYKAHKNEWRLGTKAHDPMTGRIMQTPRVDYMIETQEGKRLLVECKNFVQTYAESTRAVSQLLGYGVIAEENDQPAEMVLLVTKAHPVMLKIIKKYNLPITVLIMNKEYTALWNGNV